jgi:oligopeptide transport system ATP-binding protein
LAANQHDYSKDEVILSVHHLKQFFRFGTGIYKYNKAVHDVSFDIHRGEVLGLVGESGCGKTTTGRSIIKLYDITSGSIYFEGHRIGAGTRWNEKEIKFKKSKSKAQIASINDKMKEELAGIDRSSPDYKDEVAAIHAKYQPEIDKIKANLKDLVALQQKEIALAKHDNQFCNRDYGKQKAAEVKQRYDAYRIALSKRISINLACAELLNEQLNAYCKKSLSYSKHYDSEFSKVEAAKADLLKEIDVFLKAESHTPEEKYNFIEKLCGFSSTLHSLIDSSEFDKVDLDLSHRLDEHYQGIFKALPVDEKVASLPQPWILFKNFVIEYRVARNEKITSRIQMIFQDPIASLDPRMTVKEIIAEGLRIRGIKDKAYIQEKVEAVLKEVGLLPEHASRYPHEFSGGQRQRIGIARALIMDPDLIIADEPISALDVSVAAQVINLLNDLRVQRHLTILFIAHDLSVVKYFCNRIAVMYFGNLVELATSDELFKHPLHPYTRSLLSAIPLPDPHYEKNRKRIDYNPIRDHDYSTEKPRLQEVEPGHFVRCSDSEFQKFQTILNPEAAKSDKA